MISNDHDSDMSSCHHHTWVLMMMVSCPHFPLSPCDHVCDDWCRWHVWCDDDAMVFISGLISDDVRYRGSGSWRGSGHLVTPCVISLINSAENHVFTPTYTNMNTRHSQLRWNRGSNFHPSVAIYLNGRVALRLRWYITSEAPDPGCWS